MDELDILLNKFNEVVKTGNKDDILKLNKAYGNKLLELILSFSDEILENEAKIAKT